MRLGRGCQAAATVTKARGRGLALAHLERLLSLFTSTFSFVRCFFCVCWLHLFAAVKSGLCFPPALMTAFISPACTFPPSLSGWYPINSLGHVQCRSLVLAAKGKKKEKKKNPSQGPPKNSWLALLLFSPPFPFLLSNRPVGNNVEWAGGRWWRRWWRWGAKMSGSPCHGASNQRGESSGFPF